MPDPCKLVQHVETVESGKSEIEQDHIRRGGRYDVHDLEAFAGFGDYLVAVSLEGAPQPIPDDLVIFCNDDSCHLVPELRLLL